MYEQGVIRPPSEASSLLVRVTRNCPWNQCLFCASYKKEKFSRRTVEEVKKDIDSLAKEYEGYQVRTVFLQDGDTLVLKTEDVLEVLRYLKQKFPTIERITSYARAPTLKRRSVEELKQLKEAGLTRLHVGMESGSEKVLKMIKKGITEDDIVDGYLKNYDVVYFAGEWIDHRVPAKLVAHGRQHLAAKRTVAAAVVAVK